MVLLGVRVFAVVTAKIAGEVVGVVAGASVVLFLVQLLLKLHAQ